MSDQASKGDIHKIVNDKIKEHKGDIDKKLEAIVADNKTSTESLASVKLDQEKIKGKLDAIYGNGTGKKGILDRLEDKQDATDEEIKNVKENQQEEYKKQASFRHDVRNQFESLMLKRKEEEDARKVTAEKLEVERKEQARDLEEQRKLQAAGIKEAKKDRFLILKWILGGAIIYLFELMKTHHWLGLK